MKTKYHILLLLLASFFFSCEDNNDSGMPERSNLKLAVSTDSIFLDENDLGKEVIVFSWNEATKIGEDYSFSYLFQIDIANNNFTTAISPVTLEANTSISFTTGELYDLIVEKWGKTAGELVEIEARVAAKVIGPKFQYPEIAHSKAIVKTFRPVSQPLYILGTATEGGLDADNATIMNEVSNGRIYTWKGLLKVGNFKFITNLGSMLPSYNRGTNANTIVERTNESEPDNYFEIVETGSYFVYLSKKDMSISYKRILLENLYLVGDATSIGWSPDNALPMTMDDVNPNIFTFNGPLMEGELKILSERRWECLTVRPLVENGSIQDENIQIVENPDYKWRITADEAGLYKITLDVETKKIKFEKQ